MDEEDLVLMQYLLVLKRLYNRVVQIDNAPYERRVWVRDVFRTRNNNGYFSKTFLKLKERDPEMFFKQTRMDRGTYDLLLDMMKVPLTKHSIRTPINSECRLAVTLCYLSQGVSLEYLSLSFKIGKSTVREMILETCQLLWAVLAPKYVKEPDTEKYEEIADQFFDRWNMPNCVGAIGGKHIELQQYRKTLSIVLIASCDANYTFTHVDVGGCGSQSDGGIFQHALLNGTLQLPSNRVLPQTNIHFPYFFVGDAAMPLKENIMRPFPGQQLTDKKNILNYRLSRATRIIENSFGIMVSRWRVLQNSINCHPENCEKIVLACIALHNFAMTNSSRDDYCPQSYVDWEDSHGDNHEGQWRNEAAALQSAQIGSNNSSQTAFAPRETLADYFLAEGAIPFQFNR